MSRIQPAATFVVGGAPGESLEAWRAALLASPLVIAADGGAAKLQALGRMPDLLVGDLDSLAPAEAADLAGLRIERHPRDKDKTDLELALERAVELGPADRPIRVLGAWGGRVDHSLANAFLLALPALAGRDVCLCEGRQRLWMLQGPAELAIDGAAGDIVSLMPLAGGARLVQTEGLRWPLQGEALAFGPARAVSNEMTGERAGVRLGDGTLLCTHIPSEGEP